LPSCGVTDQGGEAGRALKRGEYLLRIHAPVTAIHEVRSGALKAYRLTPSGEEIVTGFYLPGDIVGLEGIGHGSYPESVVALSTTRTCAVPYDRLLETARSTPELQRELFRLFSDSVQSEWVKWAVLSKASAEQRLAGALVELSARIARCGRDAFLFRLPMTRQELASHLGLARETVCRLFKQFEYNGWIACSGREITLLDRKGLRRLAAGSPQGQTVTYRTRIPMTCH